MKVVLTLLLLGVLSTAGAAIFIYQGMFEISADVPHSDVVLRLMETARNRAVAVRARDIQVPPLENPERIARGARDYADMCTGCHLAPKMEPTELRQGLYPQPPNLTEHVKSSPGQMFWVIKHGIKMSSMPAWGLTHDDERIWDMVAFIQKLPDLTPAQYQALTRTTGDTDAPEEAGAPAPKGEEHAHSHHRHRHHHDAEMHQ